MTAPAVAAPNETTTVRVRSVDILRGAVMVLMAIDHVRVYAGVPAGGPTYGVFFTRWVTHFCAPVFIFLAGTAACLHGRKLGDTKALSRFLVTRGLWLVLLELTVLRFGWTFNFDYANFTFAGVIWAIGWSMVVLGLVVYLPGGVVGWIGLAIIVSHNAVGWPVFGGDDASWISRVLYAGGGFTVPGVGWQVAILYVLLPWIGVMAAGYGFGQVLALPNDRRDRLCYLIGGAAVVAFFVLRATNLYGDQRPWSASGDMPAVLSFLNTSKYPASMLFLCMTLGPAIALMPWLERASGRVVAWLTTFGKAPFFYYILHIPLIHLVALGISFARTPESTGWLFANHPLMPPEVPEGYRWSLGLLYVVTAAVVVALYFPCRWYAREKATSPHRWMKYM